ncbi:MAG: hypothetical protein RBU24_01480, partial [Kiritimatiellia bacterium]|nr:hypothetical protein [Kiritimatiellia bacterium]
MKRTAYRFLVLLSLLFCANTGFAQDRTVLEMNRRMIFDASGILFPQGSYYHPDWTHVGPAPFPIPASLGALLPGTNHYHASGWTLTACRTGTSAWRGDAYIPPRKEPFPGSLTNWHASMQNTLDANIDFPFYPEGVGTIYFNAINGTLSEPTELSVEIATNMYSYQYGYVTNILLEQEMDGLSNNWQALDVVLLTASNITDYVRYQKRVDWRKPARLRIRRTGSVHGVYTSYTSLDNAFTQIDNICVSFPPADVIVRKQEVVFHPAYPAVGESLVARCYVDNLSDQPYALTGYSNRVVKLVYRWRYLNQMTNAWTSLTMQYVAGSGVGDNERYEVVVPAQKQVGDLEYYIECDFDGYRYRHQDYTEENYPYQSENLSPRVLRGDTSVEGGREFYARLRPYPSPYGAVSVVTGPYYDENPIPMTLVSNDVWRGMIPLADGAQTNLQFYFRGDRKYVAGSDSFDTNPVYWVEPSQALIGVVP